MYKNFTKNKGLSQYWKVSISDLCKPFWPEAPAVADPTAGFFLGDVFPDAQPFQNPVTLFQAGKADFDPPARPNRIVAQPHRRG